MVKPHEAKIERERDVVLVKSFRQSKDVAAACFAWTKDATTSFA